MATVLVVDDEKNIRTHLATFVRSLGHAAETAADATAALAALERHEVDVVFSDVRMAGMDGLALRRENRTLRRALDEPALLDSASPAMQRALATVRQAAASDVTVLLSGESGTGK